MAKAAPDYSFVRDGVRLANWLERLVSDDKAARRRAGEMLYAMYTGAPSPETQLQDLDPIPDIPAQAERFKRAVHDVLAQADFDAAEFVRRLCTHRVVTSVDWVRRVDEAHRRYGEAQYERIADRLIERINTTDDETVKEEASKRLARALAASMARECRVDKEVYDGAESMTSASMMEYVIFSALDREFLAVPEALQLVLEHRQQAHDALKALARIGPPAIAFAPQLIEQIDHLPSRPGYYGFDAAEALGSIGRGHAGIVDALVQRLRQTDPYRRGAAAETLAVMGRDVAGRTDTILELLRGMLDDRDGPYYLSAVTALASVGRDDPASRKRIIDLARSCAPEMLSSPDFPDYRYDRVMGERGHAIYAMAYLVDYPDECVPVLINAIDSFEEYDPDETYNGPAERVANALAKFGLAAGAAAVPLARKLDPEPEDFPRAILDALKAVGPAAREAIPLLEAFRSRSADVDDEPLVDWRCAVPDKDLDPVGWLLRHIAAPPVAP